MLSVISLTILLCAFMIFVFYVKIHHSYWRKFGISTPPGLFLVGHTFKRLGLTEPFMQFFDDTYYNHGGKYFCGYYDFLNPCLFVGDPILLRKILENKFEHFENRRVMHLEKVNPYAHNMLTNASGDHWRKLRKILTPSMRSAKMKQLESIISEKAKSLCEHILKLDSNKAYEARSLCGKYTMDTIASCAFGINCNSFGSEDPIFPTYAQSLFTLSPRRAFKIISLVLWPKLVEVVQSLGFKYSTPEFEFFIDVIHETVNERKLNNIQRGDFIDFMLEREEITMVTLTAQSILFLLAGYDNTANTIAMALHLLAGNPEQQIKLRSELALAIEGNEEITADVFEACPFLDAVVKEVLRLYPAAPVIERTCTKDFMLGENPSILVKKGQAITIPVWSIHRDPKHWENPEKFDPTRFLEPKKSEIKSCTYLPFGIGPRRCLGFRFAISTIKFALVHFLINYEVKFGPETQDPPALDPKIMTLQPAVGIDLNFERIENFEEKVKNEAKLMNM